MLTTAPAGLVRLQEYVGANKIVKKAVVTVPAYFNDSQRQVRAAGCSCLGGLPPACVACCSHGARVLADPPPPSLPSPRLLRRPPRMQA